MKTPPFTFQCLVSYTKSINDGNLTYLLIVYSLKQFFKCSPVYSIYLRRIWCVNKTLCQAFWILFLHRKELEPTTVMYRWKVFHFFFVCHIFVSTCVSSNFKKAIIQICYDIMSHKFYYNMCNKVWRYDQTIILYS